MIHALLIFLAAVLPATAAWPNGYTYRRQVIIHHTQVAGSLTAYPFLLAGTYPDLAAVANGGHLLSTNGYDLVVASDQWGANPLNFERVSWSGATGAIVLMINLPALSNSADTTLYLFYGNSSIVTDPQNPTAVWDSNYQGVYHLADNAANTTVHDSTSTANTGNNAANTSTKSVTGPFQGGTLGSALTYNGSTDSTDLGVSTDWNITTGDATWEMWINPVTISTYAVFMSHGSYGADGYYFQWSNQSITPLQAGMLNGAPGITDLSPASMLFSPGVWSCITFVKSGTIGTWFVNGVPGASTTLNNFTASTRHLWLGRYDQSGFASAVTLSEFRFSNIARSAAWIATSYNNQNNPSAFYGIGAPQTAGTSSFIVF